MKHLKNLSCEIWPCDQESYDFLGGIPSTRVTTALNLMLIGLVEVDIIFNLSRGITCPHDQKGASQPKSLLYQIWCLYKMYKYNVILPHDITWSHDQRDIWLLQLEALTSSDQPTKFTTCRSCEGRDKTVFYLLCNLKKWNIVSEVCQTIPLIKNYFWKSIKDRMTSFYIFCHCKLFRDNKPL